MTERHPTAKPATSQNRLRGRPPKEGLVEACSRVLTDLRGQLDLPITVREVARLLGVSPQTLYNRGLDQLINPDRRSHAQARAKTAPRRTKRRLNERIQVLQGQLEELRARCEKLLVMWQTVEYNLRERYQIDPRTLYESPIPKPDRSTGRSGRRNPRISRLRAIDSDSR